MDRGEAMTYTPLPVVLTEPCISMVLRLNLPKRLTSDPDAAIATAREVAASEAERLVRFILSEGIVE